ncbi:MAG: bifunctional pyr operon transcriptional regulator/uracil phosphoribosyltransferase PyrR [Saprospiraceae bacterium]|jgi:pyrimidine operon attenuation protein/uracil phosphoribosyltransferase|nr:bifunctional pyr operon transcriptional regulator/uracil phosphoribosyltransferase PyrR [Saprospiraceae bacterium]MBP9209675.1 bifunctional pyr operon transcriptional regulator/uracil phosphoribosyltransferase PyrR [Saprospiraceae bacterium]MBV6471964.1 Bifunctional protein pyrR [Saprospiraceae bacterium]
MRKKIKTLLSERQFNLVIDRLCHQIMERHGQSSNTCLIGIQQKGALLAGRIHKRISELKNDFHMPFGKLDITFSRDDFRLTKKLPSAHRTDIDFLIDHKNVLLVDDVLYTGRTIQAALLELQNFGRPDSIELIVLVDRRFNRQLPIQADYFGVCVDAVDESYVKVDLAEEGGMDKVLFYEAPTT